MSRPSALHAIASCPSFWAERNRIIRDEAGLSRPYSFRGRRFLREIQDDLAPRVVLIKGPQVGATEVAINRVFWWIAVSSRDVLYVMPTDRDVSTFSAGRFAHALDRSEAVADLFAEVDNVSHKRARSGANLYLRGAGADSALKSIPVAGLVLDEYDEMSPHSVDLARDRTSGQVDAWEFDLSTPTLPGFGIDREYRASDRRVWRVPCPRCGAEASLEWPDSVGGDPLNEPDRVSWRCRACGEPWTEEEKLRAVDAGSWVEEDPGASIHGYRLSQLLSPVRRAADHARRWSLAQGDLKRLRGFYAAMALPHVGTGARFDSSMLEEARAAGSASEPAPPARNDGRTAAGVDAGVNRHYVEVSRFLGERKEVVLVRIARDYSEVEAILRRYGVTVVVLDANPNTERARELQRRLNSESGTARVWLAFYSDDMKIPVRWHGEQGTVTARRTELLDQVYARYASRRVSLYRDVPAEYDQHFGALSRIEDAERERGNIRARWESTGPDHFAHAAAYCELASFLLGEEREAREPVEDSHDPLIPRVVRGPDGWPREGRGPAIGWL